MAFQSGATYGYNRVSQNQLMAACQFIDDITECFKHTILPSNSLLQVADYGCSEGINSITIFSEVFSKFRKSSKNPIMITHTDLPKNDWVEFNNFIQTSEKSYLKINNVYYSTIGRSYFNQIFPKESIHIAYASYSMHYLSAKPKRNPGEYFWVFPNLITQACKDMKQLLNLRIEEIITGGYFFFIINARENINEDPSLSRYSFNVIKKLMDRGDVLPDEFTNFVWQSFPYHITEIQKILQELNGRIEIIKCEYGKILSPYYSEYLETNDIDAFEKKITDMIVVRMKNALFSCLLRSEEEKMRILCMALDEIKLTIRNEIQPFYQDYIVVILKKIS
ncbi:hypothetical protein SteCoe_18143 [Stentor coeruleus]|uniref:SAM dependent carboxyl methyltransferase n=1 Tax=Stentor coeruleus TaxID=5963 RepID=A0A1R2BXR8_9CILI|nr:hypothetical protein SteCoe_18143 [Stentor coeruleus]